MKYDRIKDLRLHKNDVVWVKVNRLKFSYEGPAKVVKFNKFQDTKRWNIRLTFPSSFFVGSVWFVGKHIEMIKEIR
jgi:hypothetical protein